MTIMTNSTCTIVNTILVYPSLLFNTCISLKQPRPSTIRTSISALVVMKLKVLVEPCNVILTVNLICFVYDKGQSIIYMATPSPTTRVLGVIKFKHFCRTFLDYHYYLLRFLKSMPIIKKNIHCQRRNLFIKRKCALIQTNEVCEVNIQVSAIMLSSIILHYCLYRGGLQFRKISAVVKKMFVHYLLLPKISMQLKCKRILFYPYFP